jgi:hypothetical protein
VRHPLPTSRTLDGSGVRNPDSDYSVAPVVISDETGDGLAEHGLAFAVRRVDDVRVAAIGVCWPIASSGWRSSRRWPTRALPETFQHRLYPIGPVCTSEQE